MRALASLRWSSAQSRSRRPALNLHWLRSLRSAPGLAARTRRSRACTLGQIVFLCVALLLCTYAGACCRYQGPVEEGKHLTSKTPVRFTWSVRAPGVDETREVQLRGDTAVNTGVSLPKGWKGELGVRAGTPAAEEFAATAIRRARKELGLGDDVKLDCRPGLPFPHIANARVRGSTRSHAC